MIISASRRTDIPACYAEWFFNRLREQYLLVRNPMNQHQISRINLAPEVVDCLVFWTKNAAPMLPKLSLLCDYRYYFLFTVNAYGTDIETNLPDKMVVADTFCRLSDLIGPERVIWRYNPLFVNEKYTHAWHVDQFSKLANKLAGFTEKCIMSFLDFYPKIRHSLQTLAIEPMTLEQIYALAGDLTQIAFTHNLKVDMDQCKFRETIDFSTLGIQPACCIDPVLVERIVGYPLKAKKDANQPAHCNCMASVEIGAYSTCSNGCQYCYANTGRLVQPAHTGFYDVNAPLLCSRLQPDDVVTERKMRSLRIYSEPQLKLFA